MRKFVFTVFLLTGSLCFSDTLILKDGSQRHGTVESTTAQSVTFREGTQVNSYPRSDIQSIKFDNATTSDYAPPDLASSAAQQTSESASTNGVTLPAGTQISVITNANIDSANASEGQTFSADVAANVVNSDGVVVIPKGSEADLILRKVGTQGTVTGNSELVLDLQSVTVNGHRYDVSTQDIAQQNKEGIGANKRTATMVGGGAALGTLIGAIAGGGKGAAIGAATGAAAGAGTQVLTRGKTVKVPAETTLSFRLDQPLSLHAVN